MSTRPKQLNPLQSSHPPAKPENGAKPLTQKLMARLNEVIDNSKGKLTKRQLAEDVGKSYAEIREYTSGFRSAPNSEITMKLIAWGQARDRSFISSIFGKR